MATVQGGCFRMIAVGKTIEISKEFRKSFGYTRAKILALISPMDRMATDGGYYEVERLDGPEDLRDLRHAIHRSAFTPNR